MDISTIPNYDRLVNGSGFSDKHISNHFLGPNQPGRIAIIGPSNSGKSNVTLDLILRIMTWKKLWYFCKNLQEDKMIFLIKQMEILQANFDKKCLKNDTESYKIFHISTDLQDLPDLDQINRDNDPDFQSLIIINDMVLSKQERLAEFFIRSRHKQVSIIYCSQFFFKMTKTMRDSCTDILLFKFSDDRIIKQLANIYGSRVGRDKFCQLYHEATSIRHNFFYIDLRTKHIELHVRRNFCGIYIGSEQAVKTLNDFKRKC